MPGQPVFGEYDDGYVRPDISGSTQLTSYWSYQNNTQFDPANGGSMSFASTAGGGALPSLSSSDDDAQGELAFEVFADLELGKIGGPSSRASWGLHFGFHYADLDASEYGNQNGTATRVVDQFPLGGVIPPLAPYAGSFTGPGPLLATDATRGTTLVPGGARITHSNDFQADLFSLNVGPWIAYAPNDRVSIQADLGLTLAFADATYKYASTVSVPGGPSSAIAGRANESDFLPGFYIGATAAYAVNPRTELYLSARYQYLDSLNVTTPSASAALSFDESFIISAGVRFKF